MTFSLPIDLERLQNDKLKLVPFEQWSQETLEQFVHETGVKNPDIWQYFPRGPFPTIDKYREFYEIRIGSQPGSVLLGIFLKTGSVTRRRVESNDVDTFEVKDGTFAGTTGLTHASPQDSKVEIGFAMVLPEFQRTFVNSTANSLLLKHMLDPVAGGDLGLRRVQWQANTLNTASMSAAQRLGFTLEGIVRWERVCADNKSCVSEQEGRRSEGLPKVDADGRRLGPGRHSAMFALCWDDWLEGKRDYVLGLLQQ